MKNRNVRLSKNIIPLKYDIRLHPDLENFTFEGIETIHLNVLQKIRIVTLHSKELEIETVKIGDVFAKISYNEGNETASFSFPSAIGLRARPKFIPAGKHNLPIVFKGILNNKMRGFYRSKYAISGKEYHMATTQFEATDARRAFPCFDEPAQKAIFNVSLIIPKGKTVISNTLPVSVSEHEGGFEVVKFSPTPIMSTYLLAFIIGDFEYIERKSKRGVIVRVYTTPGKKHQAKFALDCAVKTLEFYEKYFDIAYPLNTLDMIAIPDFSSGAMENWGAITYRESALLVDEEHSSASNKQWVALVIAHELAHQWFGNLVTMEWWTHLWLNEGFASYIEYLAVDKLFPKWDIWTQFSTNDLGVALRLDALATTHPIEVEVHHPDEIGEIFDEVSYSKGASIIRMLADYLGEENFRNGLRYYLKKHSYKNTETLHLWQAFEKVSELPVSKMMRNWTSKPGYPVVRVEMKNGEITLSQERFFASPISKAKTKDKTIWNIPVRNSSKVLSRKSLKINFLRGLANGGEPISGFFMLQKTRTGKKFDFQKSWIKMNFGEAGFYRTAYSRELLGKLIAPVKDKVLSPRDRLGIVSDLFALAEAGTIPTTDTLEFLKAYEQEDNYTVWVEIATGLARLEQLLAKSPSKNKLEKLSLDLFSPVATRLGWNPVRRRGGKGESHADTLLRSLAISRAGRMGNKKIIAEARKKFNSKSVSPDIRGAVYSIVATHGGMKASPVGSGPREFNDLVNRYKKETLHEEKNRIGGALGDFQNPKILKLACEFAMSKHVRIQDTVGILSGIGANPLGRDIWWSFIQKNWKTLVSRYGEGGLTLARAIKSISGSAEEKHFKSFKKFFATHPAPGAKRAIEQVLERLEGLITRLT